MSAYNKKQLEFFQDVAVVHFLALVALAHGLPQQQVRQRGAKQLDTNYGAPEQTAESVSAPALYGGPVADSLDALASAPQATYAGAAAGEAEGQVSLIIDVAVAVVAYSVGVVVDAVDVALFSFNACSYCVLQDSLELQASELDTRQESGARAREGEAGGDPIAMLKESIPGTPGEDYPIYAEVPETTFTCDLRVNGGKPLFKLGHATMGGGTNVAGTNVDRGRRLMSTGRRGLMSTPPIIYNHNPPPPLPLHRL